MEVGDWDKYAENYQDNIISPFQRGVKNPLFEFIRKIKNKEKKSIADIGCGPGNFLPFLSKNFEKVYALDFSEKMLEEAKKRNRKLKNVEYYKADTRKLKKYKLKFDMAVSINSILFPSVKDINNALNNIHFCLRKDGYFLGVFPAMEAISHYAMLVYERELKKIRDEKRALTRTRRIVNRSRYDFLRGVVDFKGEKQKFFYRFELINRLQRTGFKRIRIHRVLYPWKCVSGFERFKEKPLMWDWAVISRG